MGKLQLQDEEGKLLSRPRAVAALPWAGAGKLLIFLQCLALPLRTIPLHPQQLCRQICCMFGAGERKRCTRVQGLLFIYIKTLTSPTSDKQQLPA